MKRLDIGETIVLEDQKEFICFQRIQDEGKEYVFMMSNSKPLEVFFAEEIQEGDTMRLEKVADPEKKRRLMQLFRETHPTAEERETPKEPEPEEAPCGLRISVGETVELEDGQKLFCSGKIQYSGEEYICFLSQKTYRDLVFGQEVVKDGVLSLSIVKDPEKQKQLTVLASKGIRDGIKQMFRKKPKEKRSPQKKHWWQR